MQLYSMGELNWPKEPPDDIPPNETFRSREVYRCEICHTHTNEWEHRGRYGAHLLCPVGRTAMARDLAAEKPYFEDMNDVKKAKQRHHDLIDLLGEKNELKQKHNLFQDDNTDSVPSHVRDELNAVQNRIDDLRRWFDGRYDDVVGVEQDYEIEGEFSGE